MFTSVAVWRPIYVLRCGCGEANTIIIILLSDSLDMCTVPSWVRISIYSLRGIGRVLSPDIAT